MALSTNERAAKYRKRLKDSGGHITKVIIFDNELGVIDEYRSLVNGNLSRRELIQSIVSIWIAGVSDELLRLAKQSKGVTA